MAQTAPSTSLLYDQNKVFRAYVPSLGFQFVKVRDGAEASFSPPLHSSSSGVRSTRFFPAATENIRSFSNFYEFGFDEGSFRLCVRKSSRSTCRDLVDVASELQNVTLRAVRISGFNDSDGLVISRPVFPPDSLLDPSFMSIPSSHSLHVRRPGDSGMAYVLSGSEFSNASFNLQYQNADAGVSTSVERAGVVPPPLPVRSNNAILTTATRTAYARLDSLASSLRIAADSALDISNLVDRNLFVRQDIQVVQQVFQTLAGSYKQALSSMVEVLDNELSTLNSMIDSHISRSLFVVPSVPGAVSPPQVPPVLPLAIPTVAPVPVPQTSQAPTFSPPQPTVSLPGVLHGSPSSGSDSFRGSHIPFVSSAFAAPDLILPVSAISTNLISGVDYSLATPLYFFGTAPLPHVQIFAFERETHRIFGLGSSSVSEDGRYSFSAYGLLPPGNYAVFTYSGQNVLDSPRVFDQWRKGELDSSSYLVSSFRVVDPQVFALPGIGFDSTDSSFVRQSSSLGVEFGDELYDTDLMGDLSVRLIVDRRVFEEFLTDGPLQLFVFLSPSFLSRTFVVSSVDDLDDVVLSFPSLKYGEYEAVFTLYGSKRSNDIVIPFRYRSGAFTFSERLDDTVSRVTQYFRSFFERHVFIPVVSFYQGVSRFFRETLFVQETFMLFADYRDSSVFAVRQVGEVLGLFRVASVALAADVQHAAARIADVSSLGIPDAVSPITSYVSSFLSDLRSTFVSVGDRVSDFFQPFTFQVDRIVRVASYYASDYGFRTKQFLQQFSVPFISRLSNSISSVALDVAEGEPVGVSNSYLFSISSFSTGLYLTVETWVLLRYGALDSFVQYVLPGLPNGVWQGICIALIFLVFFGFLVWILLRMSSKNG